MLPKNKQNKLWQTNKDKIKGESHLNYITYIKYALFPCLFIFHDINLLTSMKKCIFFFFFNKFATEITLSFSFIFWFDLSFSVTIIAQLRSKCLQSIHFYRFNIIIVQSLPLLPLWPKKNWKNIIAYFIS